MSISAPGGSFGLVLGLHGSGSDGSKEVDEVEDEEEEEKEEEAMPGSGGGLELKMEFCFDCLGLLGEVWQCLSLSLSVICTEISA